MQHVDSTDQVYKVKDEKNLWDNSDQLDKCHLRQKR